MSGTQDNLNALCQALAALTDPADVKALLADLCTAGETEQMACRLRAAMLLLDGKTYSQITEETDISSATLSRSISVKGTSMDRGTSVAPLSTSAMRCMALMPSR